MELQIYVLCFVTWWFGMRFLCDVIVLLEQWTVGMSPVAPFTNILIAAWIINYMIHYKMWDEITYPFLNFNGCTVEV